MSDPYKLERFMKKAVAIGGVWLALLTGFQIGDKLPQHNLPRTEPNPIVIYVPEKRGDLSPLAQNGKGLSEDEKAAIRDLVEEVLQHMVTNSSPAAITNK